MHWADARDGLLDDGWDGLDIVLWLRSNAFSSSVMSLEMIGLRMHASLSDGMCPTEDVSQSYLIRDTGASALEFSTLKIR